MSTSRASKRCGADVKIRVGQRLRAAAEYVAVSSAYRENGKGIICADVGCDHGYLSIYLIEKGICDKVYATDINEKPVAMARENIKNRDTRGLGLSEKIEVRLCDGLEGLSGLGINRVVICGMGGEVISGIIERAHSFHTKEVKFILQPMSSEAELRAWLSEKGFEIEDETLLRDAGRIYTVMCVSYSGKKYSLSPSELILGKHNIEKGGELLYELCQRKLVHARNLLKQPECSEADRELHRGLCEILARLSEDSKKADK